MKNLKIMMAAVGLAAVLGISSVSANTGIMISDRSANVAAPCVVKDGGIFQQVVGILVAGLNGIMISDLNGIMISDSPTTGCDKDMNGIMISDRNGIMISD